MSYVIFLLPLTNGTFSLSYLLFLSLLTKGTLSSAIITLAFEDDRNRPNYVDGLNMMMNDEHDDGQDSWDDAGEGAGQWTSIKSCIEAGKLLRLGEIKQTIEQLNNQTNK